MNYSDLPSSTLPKHPQTLDGPTEVPGFRVGEALSWGARTSAFGFRVHFGVLGGRGIDYGLSVFGFMVSGFWRGLGFLCGLT